MATLKELMGDKVTGDGRRFTHEKWDKCFWFRPEFKSMYDNWVGVDQDGFPELCREDEEGWMEAEVEE